MSGIARAVIPGMTKKPERPSKRLRPVTDEDLRAVAGGGGGFHHGKPGEFSSSSGGGGGGSL